MKMRVGEGKKSEILGGPSEGGPAEGGENAQNTTHTTKHNTHNKTQHTHNTHNTYTTHTQHTQHTHNTYGPKRIGPKTDWPKLAGKTRWPKTDWPKSVMTWQPWSRGGFLVPLFHVASPIPGTPDSQSLRWRLSGSLCVCSFFAPHVGIASDTHVQFWRTLAASVHLVSQLHSGTSLLLEVDSNTPFSSSVVHDRLMHLFLPIVQEILQSHSLVFRNPPDRPTHRCGDIIFDSLSLPGCVTVHSGSNCCPLAPCVVLLSS